MWHEIIVTAFLVEVVSTVKKCRDSCHYSNLLFVQYCTVDVTCDMKSWQLVFCLKEVSTVKSVETRATDLFSTVWRMSFLWELIVRSDSPVLYSKKVFCFVFCCRSVTLRFSVFLSVISKFILNSVFDPWPCGAETPSRPLDYVSVKLDIFLFLTTTYSSVESIIRQIRARQICLQ